MADNILNDFIKFFFFPLGILVIFSIIERSQKRPTRIKNIIVYIFTACLLWLLSVPICIIRANVDTELMRIILDILFTGWNLIALTGTCLCVVIIHKNVSEYQKEKNDPKNDSTSKEP